MTTNELTGILGTLTGKTVYLGDIAKTVKNLGTALDVLFIETVMTGNEYSLDTVWCNNELEDSECRVLEVTNEFEEGGICEDTVFITVEFTGGTRD